MPSRTSQAHPPWNTLERYCKQMGLRMTPMRREVLEELLEDGRPQSAYQLIAAMERRLLRRILPPTVYRALSFLLENGFVSRLESQNTYVASPEPSTSGCRLFFICDACGIATESSSPELEAVLKAHATANIFTVRRQVMEFEGTCAICAASSGSDVLRTVSSHDRDVK